MLLLAFCNSLLFIDPTVPIPPGDPGGPVVAVEVVFEFIPVNEEEREEETEAEAELEAVVEVDDDEVAICEAPARPAGPNRLYFSLAITPFNGCDVI